MVTSVTDELSHVTAYAHDALNRLTSVTGADPDGGGGQSSPVTSFTYDAANNLLTEVDALSQTNSYDYDARNRLIEKTLPDPDGGSSLTAPEITFGYDPAGNLIDEGQPMFGDSVEHDYDAYGRRISTIQGTSGKNETFTYDVLGRLTAQTNSLHNGNTYDQTDSYRVTLLGQRFMITAVQLRAL